MMELAGELKAVWFLLAAAFGAVIWLVRLEGRLNTAVRDLAEMQRSINRLFAKSDKLDVIEKQTTTLVSMMQPEALERYHRTDERTQSRLEVLEEKVTELRRSGYKNV